MNHKRKKSKRQVRCTMCTKDRWKGNTKDRHSHGSRRRKAEGTD